MKKPLDKMTMKELWSLFPVSLVAPKTSWYEWYEEEEKELMELLPEKIILRIQHVGSTAIPNIWAKNIVDMMLEVPTQDDLLRVRNILLRHGWRCMSQGPHRISLNKGYIIEGRMTRVYHLHVRLANDNDELYFRDYLVANPEIAAEYERLKLSLVKEYEHDKAGYIARKEEFVKRITEIAKKEYKDRYLIPEKK